MNKFAPVTPTADIGRQASETVAVGTSDKVETMISYLRLALSLIPTLARLSSTTRPKDIPTRRGSNPVLDLHSKWRFGLAVALTTGIMVYACTHFYHQHDFHYHGDATKLKLVQGKTFENQIVPLDGYRYVACLFRNITLEYDGTGPYRLEGNRFEGRLTLSSNNKSIEAAIYLLEGLGLASAPMFDAETGLRISVNPPRVAPRSQVE